MRSTRCGGAARVGGCLHRCLADGPTATCIAALYSYRGWEVPPPHPGAYPTGNRVEAGYGGLNRLMR